MVKIALKTLSEQEFINILNNQFNALLKGGSLDDIDVFRVSKPSLRGSGFLDIFSSIGKFVLPAVKKYLAPVATEFAHGVIDDLSEGRNIKNSMKTRGKTGLKKIRSRILHGKGKSKILKKKGQGSNKKRNRKKRCKPKPKAKRTRYHDIFS